MPLWFIITTPASETHEYNIASTATGQRLIDLVCNKLGIGEKDGRMFGLTRSWCHCNSIKWVDNMDDPIVKQLPDRRMSMHPIELQLRIRYFVKAEEIERLQTKKYACCEACYRLASRVIKAQTAVQMYYLLYKIRTILEWNALQYIERHWKSYARKRLSDSSMLKTIHALKADIVNPSASRLMDVFLREADNLECLSAYEFIGIADSGKHTAILVKQKSISICAIQEDGQFVKTEEVPFENVDFKQFYPNAGSRMIQINTANQSVIQLQTTCHHRAFTFCQIVHDQCRYFIGPDAGPMPPQCNTTNYKLRSWIRRAFKNRCNEKRDEIPICIRQTNEENATASCSAVEQQTSLALVSLPPTTLQRKTETSESRKVANGNAKLVATLRAKTKQVQHTQQCQHCRDEQVQVAFYPCGHAIYCKRCAARETKCSVCMVQIKSNLQIYWS